MVEANAFERLEFYSNQDTFLYLRNSLQCSLRIYCLWKQGHIYWDTQSQQYMQSYQSYRFILKGMNIQNDNIIYLYHYMLHKKKVSTHVTCCLGYPCSKSGYLGSSHYSTPLCPVSTKAFHEMHWVMAQVIAFLPIICGSSPSFWLPPVSGPIQALTAFGRGTDRNCLSNLLLSFCPSLPLNKVDVKNMLISNKNGNQILWVKIAYCTNGLNFFFFSS